MPVPRKRVVLLVGIAYTRTKTSQDVTYVVARDVTISAVKVLAEQLEPKPDFVVVPPHMEIVPGMPSYKALLKDVACVIELAPGRPLGSMFYVPLAQAS